MSSPTVYTFHPLKRLGGIIIAKFVLPQAGERGATYVVRPVGVFDAEDQHVLGEPALSLPPM